MSAPDFQADLARGNRGEAFLVQQHPFLQPAADGERRWDLERFGPTSRDEVETVEVKTDSYDPAETPNMFIERHTNVAGGARLLGGPWRALRDGVDTFVYLYHNPKRAGASVSYWFEDLPALVAHLDSRMPHYEVRRVNARGRLSSTGVLVPRKELRVAMGSTLRKVVYDVR